MKIITKNTDYAVRALCVMAKEKDFISASRIAVKENIPLPYLHRILNRLIKEKIIVSREGKNGGVKLLKKPSEIKLAEIIRLFQGQIQVSQCIFRKNFCSFRNRCPLRKKLKKIEKSLINEFQKITIKTLIKGEKNE
ncbi:MAG: Rrf2 family transcriptional regulator [bacterium]|nr:Rrf2 family transcriptional regulator [bacterium]